MVTLDGVGPVQTERRPAVTGDSFFSVVKNIESVIEADIPLTISVNADSHNIKQLPALADFIIAKGWHSLPQVTIVVSHIIQSLDKSYPHILEPIEAAQTMVELHR